MGFIRKFTRIKAENDWAAAKRRAEAGEQFRAKPTVDGKTRNAPPPTIVRNPKTVQ